MQLLKKLLKESIYSYITPCIVLLLQGPQVLADANSDKGEGTLPVTWGAFVDTYYAYDFNNPLDHERALLYTTARRSNEFNLNLGYLDVKLNGRRIRGRFALQAGTSVQALYAAEPTLGVTSGPSLVRNIQEAVVGYQITDHLWIDAGIYFSYIGFEGFISKDNWTYTRSLGAELTPYYLSGVKLTYQWSDEFSTQIHIINGWQNVSENNGNKAVGLHAVYSPNPTYSLTYNNFYGQEPNSFGLFSPRFFNELILQAALNKNLQLSLQYDLGMQVKSDGNGQSYWHNVGLFGRYFVLPNLTLAACIENYVDPDQVMVRTNSPNGFQTWGASLGADLAFQTNFLWRIEYRELWTKDPYFPGENGLSTRDPLFVTALTLSI